MGQSSKEFVEFLSDANRVKSVLKEGATVVEAVATSVSHSMPVLIEDGVLDKVAEGASPFLAEYTQIVGETAEKIIDLFDRRAADMDRVAEEVEDYFDDIATKHPVVAGKLAIQKRKIRKAILRLEAIFEGEECETATAL